MATKKNTKKGRTTRRPTKAELERQKAIKRMIATFVLALILLFAAIKLGAFGVTIYNMIRLLVGSLAYLAILASFGYLFFFKWLHKHEGTLSGFISLFLGLELIFQAYFVSVLKLEGAAVLSTTLGRVLTDLTAFKVSSFAGGGLLGSLLYAPISFLFSNIGSYFFGLLLILLGGLLMSPWSIYDISEKAMAAFQNWREKQEEKRQLRFLEQEEKAAQAAMQAIEVEQEEAEVDPETGEILDDEDLSDTAVDFDEADYEELGEYNPHEPLDFGREEETEEADVDVEVDFTAKESLDYKLPTINLFAPDKPKNQSKEKRIVRDNIKILEETFASFGIKAAVERAEIGPSVTKYEVKPAVGVRVNRISNLADDLALALAAKDVRIEAPIPGKSLVGIEVPNSEVATVTFRELWEQSKTDASKLLEIPLGKAVNGSVRSFDLAKMPHLLVAGSTGSGKSVAVNGIIASILMKARPDEVKFMMVDPKMVELSVYNDIPHLLIPVVTNPRKASRALQKVVDEMENRYELFSKVGARNIAGYNAKVAEYNAQSEYKQVPLPLIVVIVDELADLMMV
ncbi:MAG: DNA translocase FtsK, partial [Streptococcus sanguinis]|nr:DNA translocase FtsK [Streptococcus sanguinis]